MKTILINRTLTTIALISTIQCGYGTATVSSWDALMSSSYSTKNEDTYTLDKYPMYELKIPKTNTLNSTFNAPTTLIIPSSCTVTNIGSMSAKSNLEIENNGTFNNTGDIQNLLNTSGLFGRDSIITFLGSEDITNTGKIYTEVHNASIFFSGGSNNKPQRVTTLGTQNSPGQIYLNPSSALSSRPSITIGQYSILSFGDYGKFYADSSAAVALLAHVFGNVTLNGSIEIASINASVDITKMNISGEGTIDMSPLRPYSADSTTLNTFDNHDFFICEQSQQLPNIKLPFNCKFNSIDLSNAASVSYTVLQLFGVCIDDNVIKLDKSNPTTYGDYATQSLGVTLPSDTNKINITNECVGNMSLSDLVSEMDGDQLKYNKIIYNLNFG